LAQARRLTRNRNTSTVADTLLQRLQTPTAGTVIGALIIILGGIIDVSGAVSAGTVVSILGFGLILKYRVLPARRERNKQNDA
jgi:Na+/proline symporter